MNAPLDIGSPEAIDDVIAKLNEGVEPVTDTPVVTLADRRISRDRAQKFVTPAPLKEGRVGCIVFWSARNIFVDDKAIRAALRKAEVSDLCPTCGAVPGSKCVMAGAPAEDGTTVEIESETPCAARSPALADLVREPVGPTSAMRRALARCQSGLEDGLRWYDCGVASEGGDGVTGGRDRFTVALAQQTDGEDAGAVLAKARWVVRVDAETGALTLPDHPETLPLEERAALRSLLERYRKERAYLTAADISHALVELFLSRLGGFRVKAGGAVYFVPAPEDTVTDSIRWAFHQAGVYLKRMEVTTEAGAQLADAASESLEEEAQGLLEAAQEANKALLAAMAAPDGKAKGKPQFKSVLAKLDALDGIKRRAELYGRTLGALTANVDAAAREAEAAIRSCLSHLTGGIL